MAEYTNTILNQYINKETGSSTVTKGMKQIADSIKVPSYLLEQFKSKTVAASTAQRQLTNATKRITDMSHKYGVSASRITGALESQNLRIDKTGESLINARGQTVSWDHAMGKLRQQMRPFKAHLLSLMFAGMALQKTFGGMVRQVMELTGVYDVWRATLIMLLLPILLPFSRVLMQVMFWLMKHKEVARFVGWFIVFAAVLGGIVMFLGMAGLALEGVAAWVAGAGLMKWFGAGAAAGKVGGIWGALAKLGMITLGIQILGDILKYDESKLWSSIGSTLKHIGFLSVLMKKPGAGIAFAFIGIGMEMVQSVIDKEPIEATLKKFVDGLGTLAIWYGLATGNPFIMAFGFTLMFIEPLKEQLDKWAKKFSEALRYAFETAPGAFGPGGLGKIFGLGLAKYEFPAGGTIAGAQKGGYVARTGVALIHKGENIVPKEKTGMTIINNITVQGGLTSESEARRLANILSEELGKRFERDYGIRAT